MMNCVSKPVTLFVLLAAGALIATGCGKGRPAETTLTDALVAGSWLEIAPKVVPSARRAETVKPQNFLRHVTLNADKTFVFSLRTLDGAKTKDDKKVEGTWEIDKEMNVVVFTVTDDPFKSGEEGYNWVPETLSQLIKKEVEGLGKTDVIYAEDLAGGSSKLVRQS
jgi:hypothetical protein